MSLNDLTDEESALLCKMLRNGDFWLTREEHIVQFGILEKLYASEGKFDGAMEAREMRRVWETDYTEPRLTLPYVA